MRQRSVARFNTVRYIYSSFFYCVSPLVIMRLLWRANRAPAYAHRWRERFSACKKTTQPGGLWVHAVSLGEVIAATPLIQALQKQYPDLPLTVTTLTPTGSERVRTLFGDDVFHVYAPYDLPGAVNRFLNKVQPKLALMIETELWPNIFAACKKRNIPVMIGNARLSPNSFKGYGKIGWLTQNMLDNVALVAAQTQLDADRFHELGMPGKDITITGSIKFDLSLPASLFEQAAHIRQLWGTGRSVLIAASTHEGEEDIILQAYASIRKIIPTCLLVLVPRHPERFTKVIQLCQKLRFSTAQRSTGEACSETTDVFIGDTIGELCTFYAAADIAFVGGSLVNVGGHNPLEPAACGIPTITGPHVFNFLEINRLLTAATAIKTVHNSDELAKQVCHLFQNPNLQEEMVAAGKTVVEQNRGALQTHLDLIDNLLTKNSQS